MGSILMFPPNESLHHEHVVRRECENTGTCEVSGVVVQCVYSLHCMRLPACKAHQRVCTPRSSLMQTIIPQIGMQVV